MSWTSTYQLGASDWPYRAALVCAMTGLGFGVAACAPAASTAGESSRLLLSTVAVECDPDNGGITVPEGFCAVVVAEELGEARHLAVRDNGDIYVNRNEGRRRGGAPGLVALRDADGDGRAEIIENLGTPGGTGVEIQGETCTTRPIWPCTGCFWSPVTSSLVASRRWWSTASRRRAPTRPNRSRSTGAAGCT